MVAIAFWTWLWGPVGLLLATLLTVSLGVLGRYVPQLECLGILLSDEPVPETHTGYYQLCKRRRTHFPAIKIVVGHWGFLGNSAESQHLLYQAGADAVETTLHDTCSQLMQLASLSTVPRSQAEHP